MFSAWHWNSWFVSIGAEVFMLSLLTGFSAFATALMFRIWGEACCDAAMFACVGRRKSFRSVTRRDEVARMWRQFSRA